MARRQILQNVLEEFLGSKNVYFQPPTNMRMSYPAIVYDLDNPEVKKADNMNYSVIDRYSVTLIVHDPDSPLIHNMLHLEHNGEPIMVRLDRPFCSDNLNHYVYTIYF